jgi:mannose-6-phosphate isomerase class I
MESNYDKYPAVELKEGRLWKGWNRIGQVLEDQTSRLSTNRKVIVVETYQGVHHDELIEGLNAIQPDLFMDTRKLFHPENKIREMTWPDVTDDRVFGFMTRLTMQDFIDPERLRGAKDRINRLDKGVVLVYGYGASLVAEDPDILVWADMARWEIQNRMRANQVDNLGVYNKEEAFSGQYKRGYFVDWRVCDRLKREHYERMDFLLDTNQAGSPKMIDGHTFREGLRKTAHRPFRVVPFFDPGPWGGQWMKYVVDLDKEAHNFAWCFDCVPEENSLQFRIDGENVEIPSINLVFYQSTQLLGEPVEARFGKEFPIRFDFLDTMEGGNLSFQIHPTTDYIQEHFGMHYTQDESYYLLDAADDGTVFLGLREGIDPEDMKKDLREADHNGQSFDVEKYVNRFPAKKHDHFLIPAGTVHCSGKNSMVLEISSTPYIFTFKMYDWGRLGLDGQPRPINVERGICNIQWDRDTQYVEEGLINRVEVIGEGDGWREERTGLHPNEPIETRRHWFSKRVHHQTHNSVNVLNLVKGREAIVESPEGKFEPFVVHYAETFIVPEAVKEYTIRPHGESEGQEIATIKAFIRN